MTKERIASIEYIRGIAMLGVVGIHTGAYSLSNPHVNIHLFALLEIVSRFSVPIFFFVSAFGLFLHDDLSKPFRYLSFLMRRAKAVLLPYIVWSLLYMTHYTWVSGDSLIWEKPLIYEFFLFGLASYQLYFLVILLWFYALMPLWRLLIRHMLKAPRSWLALLLGCQIAVNYWSTHLLDISFANHYLAMALQYRVSYWVIHYLFIFLFGALCARQYREWITFLRDRQKAVYSFFLFTLTAMLGTYYYLLASGRTAEQAVNITQQLSPPGVLYTASATAFLLIVLETVQLPHWLRAGLAKLGEHSYAVYLVHPFVMYYLMEYLTDHQIIMTATVVICFYLATVLTSLAAAQAIRESAKLLPFVGLLLTGIDGRAVKQQSG